MAVIPAARSRRTRPYALKMLKRYQHSRALRQVLRRCRAHLMLPPQPCIFGIRLIRHMQLGRQFPCRTRLELWQHEKHPKQHACGSSAKRSLWLGSKQPSHEPQRPSNISKALFAVQQGFVEGHMIQIPCSKDLLSIYDPDPLHTVWPFLTGCARHLTQPASRAGHGSSWHAPLPPSMNLAGLVTCALLEPYFELPMVIIRLSWCIVCDIRAPLCMASELS